MLTAAAGAAWVLRTPAADGAGQQAAAPEEPDYAAVSPEPVPGSDSIPAPAPVAPERRSVPKEAEASTVQNVASGLRDPAFASAALSRQIDILLGETGGSMAAARDSLEAIWAVRGVLPAVQQAAAAAALGEHYRESGDWQRCVTWYGRAIEINTSEFQARMRDGCLDRLRGGP
jgi:hypothetical protein